MEGKLNAWLPVLAAVVGVSILAATTVSYFNAQRAGTAGSYGPFVVGTLSFAVVIGAATFMAARQRSSVALWVGVASIGGGVAFALALLFILLNTMGS